MEKKLALRGVLAGAFAGLLAFVFARILAEPKIQQAIDYESARDHAQDLLNKAAGIASEPEDHELFSRTVQGNLGIGVGMIAFGAAMGLLFTVAYTVCLGRVGRLQPKPLALLVALFGFLGLYLVPFVKYPANPPAANLTETIGIRTELFFVLLLVSAVVVGLCASLWRNLAAKGDGWRAAMISGAAYILVMAAAIAIMPSINETPADFSADVLWRFRLASMGIQLVMWTTLGLGFGILAERVVAADPRQRRADALSWGR